MKQSLSHESSSKRREKDGCTTCRKRRVKCDKRRPACHRCESAGRHCEGYGIWGGGSAQSSLDPPSRGLPMFPGSVATQEEDAFAHFQRYMTTKLPGIFNSDFWERLVLQVSVQEPAVFHSAIALAAAQRGEESLTLRAYNLAIGELQHHLRGQDIYSLRVTLVSCMVFTCLEFIRGARSVGETHFQNGLKLVRELQSRTGHLGSATESNILILQAGCQSFDDCIVEAFTRLNVQSALMQQGSSYHYQLASGAHADRLRYKVPDCFSTVNEARQHLDLLITGVLYISSQAADLALRGARLPARLRRRHRQLQVAIDEWQSVLDSSPCIVTSNDVKTSLSVTLLRIYHTMSTIMASVSLCPDDEMVYDAHMPTFASILKEVWQLWTRAATEVDMKVSKLVFTTDLGFIPPLYYAALKCRDPNMRRTAIDLLGKAPHMEAAWDGEIAATVAKTIMQHEENGIYDGYNLVAGVIGGSTIETGASAISLPIIPHSARLSYITIGKKVDQQQGLRIEATKRVREAGTKKLILQLTVFEV